MVKPSLDVFDNTIPAGGTNVVHERLSDGVFLTHVALGYDAFGNSPPIRAFVAIEGAGLNHMTLVGGWIRSTSIPSHTDDLVWDGAVQVPVEARLRFAASNDTGAEQTVRCYYSTHVDAPVGDEVEK